MNMDNAQIFVVIVGNDQLCDMPLLHEIESLHGVCLRIYALSVSRHYTFSLLLSSIYHLIVVQHATQVPIGYYPDNLVIFGNDSTTQSLAGNLHYAFGYRCVFGDTRSFVPRI